MEIIQNPCHYCKKENIPNKHTNGINRLDINKSYSLENCVSCCTECNSMKEDLSLDMFINQCCSVATKNTVSNLPKVPRCFHFKVITNREKLLQTKIVIKTPKALLEKQKQAAKEKEADTQLIIEEVPVNKHKRLIVLPDISTGITAEMIPPYVCYSKARDKYGDQFYISEHHPNNKTGKCIYSTKSKSKTTAFKLNEILEKLKKIQET